MFDAYHKWLGIPPAEQPPNHYRLLGITVLEDDPAVIENAADQRVSYLRSFQISKHNALAERLLKEVTVAKLCLLNPERKAQYDASLRTSQPVQVAPVIQNPYSGAAPPTGISQPPALPGLSPSPRAPLSPPVTPTGYERVFVYNERGQHVAPLANAPAISERQPTATRRPWRNWLTARQFPLLVIAIPLAGIVAAAATIIFINAREEASRSAVRTQGQAPDVPVPAVPPQTAPTGSTRTTPDPAPNVQPTEPQPSPIRSAGTEGAAPPGSIVPGAMPVAGEYALQFIRPDSAVTVPTLIRDDTGPITIEMRLQVRDRRGAAIRIGGEAACVLQLIVNGNGGLLARERSANSNVIVVAPQFPPANNWRHVALVLREADATLFIDGHQVARQAKHPAAHVAKPVASYRGTTIGAEDLKDGKVVNGINGTIREIRISKSPRYVNDFVPEQRFTPDQDTLALYHCDEGFGDVLIDSSGHAHNGQIVGAKWVKADSESIASFGSLPFQQWIKDVAGLPAEKQVEAVIKKLQQLNPGFDGKETHKIENGVVTQLQFVPDGVPDISPLRALTGLTVLRCTSNKWDRSARLATLSDLSPLKGLKLTTLDCRCTNVSDLSPLTGMPLTLLGVEATNVSDLSPLKGLPLTTLWCHSTFVSDLSPLQGVPLKTLFCSNTQISDLSPLKNMPLDILWCFDTNVSDLSPLEGMNLKEVTLAPKNITKGINAIRQMKSLTSIGIGWQAANRFSPLVFWNKYDAGEFGKPNREPLVANKINNPVVPQPRAPGPAAAGGVPQQNPGEWIVQDDKQDVVAVFPEVPQYIYHLSADHGRMKEWKCTTKSGLQVSFQMLQKSGGDQIALVAKLVGPGLQLNLDANFSQEFVTPAMLARIRFTESGLLVLKFTAKGRNLSADEIATFRRWKNDLQTSVVYLESKTNAERKDKNANAWVLSDDIGQPIATFLAQPEYHYTIETSAANSQQKECLRVQEWKCIKDGAVMSLRLYNARGADSLGAALRQAQLNRDVKKLNAPDRAGFENVTPSFVARISESGGYSCVLSLRAIGRELSGPELDLYDSWATTLPLGWEHDRPGPPAINLRELVSSLVAKTTKQNKPPGWTVEIGGRVVAEFPSKPIHHSTVTKNSGKIQEWTSIGGQARVSFYTFTIADAQSLGSSDDVKKWLTTMFSIERPQLPPLYELRPNLLVDLEWTNDPVRPGRISKTATILAIAAKAGTLSQKELELYDEWNGGDPRKNGDPQKNFEAVAEYLGKNVP